MQIKFSLKRTQIGTEKQKRKRKIAQKQREVVTRRTQKAKIKTESKSSDSRLTTTKNRIPVPFPYNRNRFFFLLLRICVRSIQSLDFPLLTSGKEKKLKKNNRKLNKIPSRFRRERVFCIQKPTRTPCTEF